MDMRAGIGRRGVDDKVRLYVVMRKSEIIGAPPSLAALTANKDFMKFKRVPKGLLPKEEKKMVNKRISVMVLCLFLVSSIAFAQSWQKRTFTVKWGDDYGYASYSQIISTATGLGNAKTVSMTVQFGWSAEQPVCLIIHCKTNGDLTFNPAYSFMDESITLSLRSNGVTKSYTGFTSSDSSSWQTVAMAVLDGQLINQLNGSGTWDVLIEGKDWYIRTTIRVNLPKS
jgi:hypothetical protein